MMYLDQTVPSTIHEYMRSRSSPSSPSLRVAAHLAVIFKLAVGEVIDDDEIDDEVGGGDS